MNKITRKEAARKYRHIISAGYCELYYAGIYEGNRVGFNYGIYGWNWDLIPITNYTAVCTGYRSTIGEPLPEELRERLSNLRIVAAGYVNGNRTKEESRAAEEESRLILLDYVERIEAED